MRGKKTGGRQKGTPNKITTEAQDLARQLLASPKYLAKLQRRLDSGRIAPAVETTLWHYAYGKPAESVKHSGKVTIGDVLDASWRDIDGHIHSH